MTEIEKSLGKLAEEINAEHRAFVGTFRKSVEHGIRAGELLAEAKSQCPHGTWLSWLEENFEGAPRTAQEYMQLYNLRDAIRARMRDSAHLSVSGALKMLSEPRPALSASTLERYPFLENYSDGPEHIERVARRLDEMPQGKRQGFSREFAITGLVWLEFVINRMADDLVTRAYEEYGLELSTESVKTWDVVEKLYPGEMAAITNRIGMAQAREAELDQLEEQVCPVDVPPGREREVLSSMLSETDMYVPLAALQRRGRLGDPVRFLPKSPGDYAFIEHALLAHGLSKS